MKTGLNTKEDLPMEKQAGLTGQEVEERIRSGQVNRMENHMVKTNKEIVKAHLLTYFNFLNLFLAILVLITGQFKNMTFMGVVIVNAVIGIVQELKVKKVVDKLTVLTASKAHVVREGEKYEIDIEEVVKDDILIVTNGDQICADCTVLECDGLEVNESMLTGESKPVKNERVRKMRDRLIEGLLKIPESRLNGDTEHRLAGNVNISVRGVEGESLLLSLDLQGVAASSGSACTSGSLDPSHVLLSLGLPHEVAHGSLRLSINDENTEEDVDYILEVLPPIVKHLRSMSPLWERICRTENIHDYTLD